MTLKSLPSFLGSSSCPRQGRRRLSITTSPDPLIPSFPSTLSILAAGPSSLPLYPARRPGAAPSTSSLSPFPRGGGATTEPAAIRRGTPGSRGRSCTPQGRPLSLTRRFPDIPAKVGHRCCRSCSCWTRDPKSTPPYSIALSSPPT